MNRWWTQDQFIFSKNHAYFATIILMASASMLRVWPLQSLGSNYAYLTYYPAMILAAVMGGFLSGILATTLACCSVSLLWPLFVSEAFVKTPSDLLAMVFFAFNGLLISVVAEGMRRAHECAMTEHHQLGLSLKSANQGYWNLNLETYAAERSLLHDQIFGYAVLLPEWTYSMFLSHVHPDDRQFVDKTFKTAIAEHGSWAFECRIYRADDKSMHWIWASGEQVKIGQHQHMLGLIQDITERKYTELVLRKLTNKFKVLLEAIPDCLLICNDEGLITFANKASERIFGYVSKELMGQKIEFLIPDRYLMTHQKHIRHYFEASSLRPMGAGLNLYGKHRDGHEFSVEISLSPIELDDGLFTLATVRDITERKKTEDAKAMLLALVESSDEAIIGKDLKGIIFSWNKAAEDLYGYTSTEMIGRSVKRLFPEDKQDEFEGIMHEISHCGHIKNKESFRVHKDGHTIPVSITISPIINSQGKVMGASTTARDITQEKLLEKKLRHLAEHDPLTGLINRPLFEDRIEQAISQTKRQKDLMAVCFLDIDDFKNVNDLYGHTTGDLLLCAVTKRIQSCLREIDTFARLGGDEFALILLSIKKESDVVKIVKKIMHFFSKGFLIENHPIQVTLSVGISLYPRDGEQSHIEKADAAMYYVKNHGKNNFKFYDNRLTVSL